MAERKREDARGRFRVGDLGVTDLTGFFREAGIREGDVIVAADGFPSHADQRAGPRVVHEKALHHTLAYYVGELYERGLLEPVD